MENILLLGINMLIWKNRAAFQTYLIAADNWCLLLACCILTDSSSRLRRVELFVLAKYKGLNALLHRFVTGCSDGKEDAH